MPENELTPDEAANFVCQHLAGVPEDRLDGVINDVLDRLFLRGYPDIVAAMFRRFGMPESRVYESIMQAADRLGRDQDLVGEIVWGDWG